MAPLVRTGGSRHTGLAALPHRNIQRKSTEKEKSAKLEEGDAEKLCSIIEMETPESCLEYSNAIVHAFQKFRVLPQLSVNGIETKVLK